MKKGTVVYLTGADALDHDFDEQNAFEQLGLCPDWTVVAAGGSGFYDMDDAMRMLVVRGAGRVDAVKAQVTAEGSVEIFGEPMRVFG